MDFPKFYKELEAEFLGAGENSWGYNFFNWSSDWGRILLGVSGPSSQLKFYDSFGHHIHEGFHLLKMILGASGSPPCGYMVNPLVDFLALVMAYETKHRIVLKNEKKLHHLEEALPEVSPATAIVVVRNAYTRKVAEQQEVACLMLVSMTPEIQKSLEDRTAFEILQELKTMFQQQAEQELFETVKAFHACKQEEG
ncbi:hypothetical protein Tco_0573209 [Tanacetum coccineum]